MVCFIRFFFYTPTIIQWIESAGTRINHRNFTHIMLIMRGDFMDCFAIVAVWVHLSFSNLLTSSLNIIQDHVTPSASPPSSIHNFATSSINFSVTVQTPLDIQSMVFHKCFYPDFQRLYQSIMDVYLYTLLLSMLCNKMFHQ